ncbi:MAG: hypothetical protein KAT34_08220 [Candidatus Aminicenantes bacterium]|nr:hypothetical protein [Candidatus Aminicenantes bacterium]
MEKFEITVQNRLVAEKRDVNVYHHSARSANMISHSSSITLALRTVEEDDYLHLSVVSGPGRLRKACVIDLPSWADFEFSSVENGAIIHSGNRTLLKIPPGPPKWQLKITRPSDFVNAPTEDYLIIGNSENVPGGC